MKTVCVVPPLHLSVNEIGHGYTPPLGLLSVAGPLLDAGFEVELLDADAGHLSSQDVIRHLQKANTRVVLLGHSGSSAANPASLAMMRDVKAALPHVVTVYGGVYPTFASEEVMRQEAAVDFIVQGEGEVTMLELALALQNQEQDLGGVLGVVWRQRGEIIVNPPRPPIEDLDPFRVAWELADWSLYPSHHLPGRSAIVQFSRGCPNTCTYCGQWMFWKRWRHRSIGRFVDELQRLHEQYGVRTVWIADENWGCDRRVFGDLIQAIIARGLDMHFFTAMCAEDIVRDASRIDHYRRAGIICVMMGVESFDEIVLARIGKKRHSSTTAQAVALLLCYGFNSDRTLSGSAVVVV